MSVDIKNRIINHHNASVDRKLQKKSHFKIMADINKKQKKAREQYYSSGKHTQDSALLASLKGKYKGQRCFVIGNGPSLKLEDLNKLKGEITFAANRIYRVFDKTDWRPTYYCSPDGVMIEDEETLCKIPSAPTELSFLTTKNYIERLALDNICFIEVLDSRKYLKHPHFSDDASRHLYSIGTVLYLFLQLSAFMGFSEVYLLGVDCSYATMIDSKGHVLENKDNSKKSYPTFFAETKKDDGAIIIDEMFTAFKTAAKYADKHNNFNIYNATRGGALETFERVDFDSLF